MRGHPSQFVQDPKTAPVTPICLTILAVTPIESRFWSNQRPPSTTFQTTSPQDSIGGWGYPCLVPVARHLERPMLRCPAGESQ